MQTVSAANTTRLRRIISVCACLFALYSPTSTADHNLTLSVEHYPPFSLVRDDGSITGMDVEIVRAAFDAVNIPVTIRYEPWKRALKNTERGRVAGLLSCFHTPEREQYLYYSDPFSASTVGATTRVDYSGPPIQQLSDLSSIRLAAVDGWATHQEVAALGYTITPIANLRSALQTVLYRDISAYYGGLEAALYTAHQMHIENRLQQHRLSDKPATPLHLCMGKVYPEAERYISAFNQGLHRIQQQGEYLRIRQRYGLN